MKKLVNHRRLHYTNVSDQGGRSKEGVQGGAEASPQLSAQEDAEPETAHDGALRACQT